MADLIVLLGPPGAGKGTQAKVLSRELNLAHISSGDLFRDHLSRKTELGVLAQGYMQRGELVPDNVTISMIRERMANTDCAKGAILDGFPRTVPQAEALDLFLADSKMGAVRKAPYIKVEAQVLVERLGGRWSCRAGGHVYHEKFNPPKAAGVCDVDGSALYQREDDKAETVANRIRVYFEQTTPLIEYYRRKGVLAEIDGAMPIEDVTRELLASVR
ncbi:MAG: adenylate kinase [Anaerolineales bacterium]|nr:adenylate kinase [Anaerolineales bacterium]